LSHKHKKNQIDLREEKSNKKENYQNNEGEELSLKLKNIAENEDDKILEPVFMINNFA